MSETTMTGAEFRCVRESLGLNTKWMTAHLDINERTLLRWEFGRNPVREFAAQALQAIEGQAAALVAEIVAEHAGIAEPWIETYSTDEQYWADWPESPYPAAWHRAVAFRAARQLPGARIEYRPGAAAAE